MDGWQAADQIHLMVTHNIEEAVLMCDRVLVFSSNPGRVASELIVPFRIPATGWTRHSAKWWMISMR